MTEHSRLTPTCFGCGCERSQSWLFVSGQTKLGHPQGGGVWARTLLCADCEANLPDKLVAFIDGLDDGWVCVRDPA
jgi:hypothetical protein